MLKYSDDLNAVAQAFKNGELAAENVHVHLAPRLESAPEKEARRLLNDLELAVYTLPEPSGKVRILEILEEASRVAAPNPSPGTTEME